MRSAFEHDNQNANVLNHLANHFFYKDVGTFVALPASLV
jgi:hypothetical protein